MKLHLLLFLAISVLLVKSQSDTNYRLNSAVWPTSYTITIAPHFDTGDDNQFTYEGEVEITLRTEANNVNSIKLHSEDLVFSANNITLVRGTTTVPLDVANPLTFNTTYSFVYINLNSPLEANTEHTLTISYTGPIRSDLNGFYRSYYTEQGVTKWLGATQMEPTHARKVFPCFDEPEYKAEFTIIIERPQAYNTVLANTELESSLEISAGYFRDTFFRTPIMSTYLVAFLVSEFSGVTSTVANRPLGVYTRPEAINQTEYALEMGRRTVDELGDYLYYDYYSTNTHIKLDHIALPDFRAGAMENWGLVKYREGSLLYVPEESTPAYKYNVAQIVAHETAHMWFGDLVTCHWWSNIWLNEGFANYFQNFIIDKIDPDLGAAQLLVTSSLHAAFNADQSLTSPALTNDNINSPAEISGHFGDITYQKGGSIIRMIHNLIGDNAFRRGLNSYLDTNAFQTGDPTKMYEALERGVNLFFSFSNVYPGQTVSTVMSSWISQPGHPVVQVNVDRENKQITLNQSRFFINSSIEADNLYSIPITYTTENESNFEDTTPPFIMNAKTYVLNLSNIDEDDWIIFNIQETGYYRVNYDEQSWKSIARGLKGESRTLIHTLNRAKIVNDLFAFVNADVVEFELLYEVLDFLAEEGDYSVWNPAIRGFNSLRNKFMYDTNAVAKFDQYVLNLMTNAISQLGFEEREDDSFITLRNRMQIIDFACKVDHQQCIDTAVTAFKQFRDNGIMIAPSLRPISYCMGLRYGDGSDFDFLWDRMINVNVANEALIIQSALGCTRVEEKVHSLLETILEELTPIRTQDITSPLTSVLQDPNNVPIALEFVQNNYANLSTIYPSMGTVLSYFPNNLHSDNDLDQFEQWLNSCDECSTSDVNTARSAISNARDNIEWGIAHYAGIIDYLPGAASLSSPSVIGIMIALISILLMQY